MPMNEYGEIVRGSLPSTPTFEVKSNNGGSGLKFLWIITVLILVLVIKSCSSGNGSSSQSTSNVPQTNTLQQSSEQKKIMEDIGLTYGYYESGISQGDGAFPVELELNEDGTFRLYCYLDLFNKGFVGHTYTGTFTIDRFNESGEAVLVFVSDIQKFEMTWDGKQLRNDKFSFWVN